MEDEAYVQSFYMAWIFFPIFILIAVVQGLLIELYNKKYHPFNIILEGATKKGKILFPSMLIKYVYVLCAHRQEVLE